MKVNWKDKSVIEHTTQAVSSYADLLRSLGLSNVGSNFRTAKKWLIHHNISTSHFNVGYEKARQTGILRTHPLDVVFCENSHVTQAVLRRAVIRNHLLPYMCSECGMTSAWNNKPITLQLDHVNGVNGDNRLDNLRWLCPNCHSQTNTFAGKKNLKKR